MVTPSPSRAAAVPELVERVHGVMKATVRRLQPALAEEGVTIAQFWALHVVSSDGTASVSAVARTLGVSAPTACGSIDQLEGAGLVRRQRSARDHREVELTLTARGKRVEERLWRRIAEEMSRAARAVPADDLAAAIRVFREVGARLGEMPVPEEVAA